MRWLLFTLLMTGCAPGEDLLSGSWTIRHQTGAAETIRAGDWEGGAFDVLVEGDDGRRSSVTPRVEDGRFVIESLAAGRYYVRRLSPVSERLDVWFSRGGTIALDYAVLGRSGGTHPEEETSVAIEGAGLQPWEGGHSLQVVAPGAGAVFWADSGASEAGATEISLAMPWERALLEARAGDQLLVLQYVRQDNSGSAARLMASPPTTLVEGRENVVQGEFVAVPRRQIAANVALAGLGEYVSGAEQADLSVHALPRAARYGWYAEAPALGSLRIPLGAGQTEASVYYGDPFPPPWEPFLVLSVSSPPSLDPAGQTWLYATYPVSAEMEVAPSITPVRNVEINGLDAMTPLTGVGERPRLTWDPPAVGEPERYVVVVRDGLDRLLAVVRTEEPSLLLPPEVLEPYARYRFEIIARLPRALPGGAAAIQTADMEP